MLSCNFSEVNSSQRFPFHSFIHSGIAAGGILRLLLANRTYNACQGGATLLTRYAAYNVTASNGVVTHYAGDYVSIWQVCYRTKETSKDHVIVIRFSFD